MHDQKDPDIQRAMELAGTQTGQQLVNLLQEKGGQQLSDAMSQAAAGDFQRAREALSDLMALPEIQALLQELGG